MSASSASPLSSVASFLDAVMTPTFLKSCSVTDLNPIQMAQSFGLVSPPNRSLLLHENPNHPTGNHSKHHKHAPSRARLSRSEATARSGHAFRDIPAVPPTVSVGQPRWTVTFVLQVFKVSPWAFPGGKASGSPFGILLFHYCHNEHTKPCEFYMTVRLCPITAACVMNGATLRTLPEHFSLKAHGAAPFLS